MTFSSHTKSRIILSFVTVLMIVSAFTAAIVARGAIASHASGPAVVTYTGEHQTVSVGATTQISMNTSSQVQSTGKTRVTPLINRGNSAATPAAAVQSSPPDVADAGITKSSLLQNFSGLNSVDSFNANGFILEPPDQGLCVGFLQGTKVEGEIINDVVAFYRPNGTLFSGKENLNIFFSEPADLSISDPRCYYDATTGAWFFTVVVYNGSSPILAPNYSDLLVLHPNLTAIVYRFDTALNNDTAGQCPCFGDQPKLGIDQNNVYITVDQFGGPGQSLETGDTLFAISKSQVLASAPTVNFAEFNNLSLGGIGVTSLEPAITNSPSNAEFLLNSFPYADEAQLVPNTIEKLLGLWALSNTQAVTAGGMPKLSATLITSEIYGYPVPALTTNGLSLATFSNDSRMQQVQFINGQLWGSLDSAVAVDNDPVTRDGAAWFEINPIVGSNGKVQGAQFTDQGYVAVKGEYLVYPAITTTFAGTTGISFSITNTTLNPSTGYVVRNSGSADFGNIHLTSKGSDPDIGFTCMPPLEGTFQQCRWGDYSWSALDPDGTDLWMAGELTVPPVATLPNFTPLSQTNWGTQVWEVSA